MNVTYWGTNTWIAFLIVLIVFWPAVCCVACCKCDQRDVYVAPGGVKYTANGAIAQDCEGC